MKKPTIFWLGSFALLGVASIVYGCLQIYQPLAFFAFGGIVLFAIYRIINK